jgi:hypothetical protein
VTDPPCLSGRDPRHEVEVAWHLRVEYPLHLLTSCGQRPWQEAFPVFFRLAFHFPLGSAMATEDSAGRGVRTPRNHCNWAREFAPCTTKPLCKNNAVNMLQLGGGK